MRLYNTRTRCVEPFVPTDGTRVRMYVCGMTVYDLCHIGHARAMITFDVVYRYLVHRGYEVVYVRNHTDVDDKIIARAQEAGEPALELSNRFIDALHEDLAGLGLRPPTHEPKVSDHIPQIIALVEDILARGHGYVVGGDVFFAVESFPWYGQLSGRSLEDARVGDRIAVDDRKRHPADFALWKAAQPGEPWWDSPWGKGRPGWHIECSAMARHYLGDSFDIHGGGADLVFPHHENEIAQSEAATGVRPFVRVWMHNGMVTLAEQKMSKSLGNIVRIRDILREIPGEALKLLYLEAHYRSPVPYSSEGLVNALGGLDRLYQAREAAAHAAAQSTGARSAGDVARDLGGPVQDLHDIALAFEDRFHAAMDEDLNTSEAIGLTFELVRAVNRVAGAKGAGRALPVLAEAHACFETAAVCLGIGELAPGEFFEEMRTKRLRAMGIDRAEVEARVAERTAARLDRDWTRADAIRSDLDAKNIVVMDGPEGTTWRVRV
ncbi:MAG: cysteine--tRNA ligase [Deltaproteobacteria bacterium]|nr:cysteine--tRNA ligase [Deltaproteobacteria bacterium]